MHKILGTVGCGFIGTNFILKNIDKVEVEILNIDKLTYSSNRDSLLHLEDRDDYNFIIRNKLSILENSVMICPLHLHLSILHQERFFLLL